MKLYANGILLNAAAQSVTLEKSRGDAAATLTAVLLTAAADRYFPKESLALGDAVRLLGDAGEEVFLGAVQAVSRNVETVTLIACDRGLYLTANEMSGVFAGSPEGICRAVAMRLSLPVGTPEVPAGWKRLVAGAGVRAFDILRQAVGEDREISIQNGALLRPEKSLDGGGALFGTRAGISPLTVRVGGCEVSEGLFRPAGMSLRAEDVGRTLALLPCEEGFLLLFFVE